MTVSSSYQHCYGAAKIVFQLLVIWTYKNFYPTHLPFVNENYAIGFTPNYVERSITGLQRSYKISIGFIMYFALDRCFQGFYHSVHNCIRLTGLIRQRFYSALQKQTTTTKSHKQISHSGLRIVNVDRIGLKLHWREHVCNLISLDTQGNTAIDCKNKKKKTGPDCYELQYEKT